MTIEEVQQTLQTVAGNQAQLTEAQIGYEARQTRLEETVKQIAEAHKTLIELVRIQEERIDGQDEARRDFDEGLNALVNAQVRYEARQEKLEEAFRQVATSHAQLVEMLQLHEERLDGHDEADVQTESRLDGLIDAQIDFSERLSQLAAIQAEHRKQSEDRGARLDEKLVRLQEAQARTAAQIRMLINRNGSK